MVESQTVQILGKEFSLNYWRISGGWIQASIPQVSVNTAPICGKSLPSPLAEGTDSPLTGTCGCLPKPMLPLGSPVPTHKHLLDSSKTPLLVFSRAPSTLPQLLALLGSLLVLPGSLLFSCSVSRCLHNPTLLSPWPGPPCWPRSADFSLCSGLFQTPLAVLSQP